jgi:acetylornithine/succinyldiaminopimelate/putrescine aminotransferase
MMMGLKWANEMCGPLMTVAGFQHGLLTIYANHDQSVNQLLPPLTIDEDEAQQVIAILERMIQWLEQTLQG